MFHLRIELGADQNDDDRQRESPRPAREMPLSDHNQLIDEEADDDWFGSSSSTRFREAFNGVTCTVLTPEHRKGRTLLDRDPLDLTTSSAQA